MYNYVTNKTYERSFVRVGGKKKNNREQNVGETNFL